MKLIKTDLIIIGTINGNLEKEIKANYEFIPWMIEQRLKNNTEIASLCSSAFLLAETGLLDGKVCTTHWSAKETFQQMYPHINLLTDKIITDQDGIYTSGGAYSFLNLVLYLVEKYSGREAALWCSKMFEIEFNRESQSQFTIFRGQKEHDDKPIKEAQQYIENNFGDKISVEDLATMFALSRRNFVRRFKKATSNAPLEYIQRVKIEAAKKKLEASAANVSEVMYEVGYNDNKAFRLIFKKYTGLSPKEYRNRYNREKVYRIA
jgi:transcriptional regulator GlxA family with amidase domain